MTKKNLNLNAEPEEGIFLLEPAIKETIWGGSKLKKNYGKQSDKANIAESWECSVHPKGLSKIINGTYKGKYLRDVLIAHPEYLGNKIKNINSFPFLIKFIDAKDKLSVQVHPTDEYAKKHEHGASGKTEMWYVIKADKDASLYSGFSQQITPDEYVERVKNNTIMDVLQRYDVNAGDVFFLPAGRVHAIGAGCFIAEIQQTSNITYRIYDYNRKDKNGNTRELHTELAKDAIDYTLYPDYRTHYKAHSNATVNLADCNYFTTNLIDMDAQMTRDFADLDSFVVYICMEGNATICDNNGYEITVHQGQTVLIPATIQSVQLTPAPRAKFLEAYIK